MLKKIYQNIRSYNKHITNDYLSGLTPTQLLPFLHPLDRLDFAKEMQKEGLITKNELDEKVKFWEAKALHKK
jgi:hypothetical protein